MFLSLFCFSMLNLVLADNLFQVFVSWELVGICSFLLIGFYYERQSASNAANKAFIVNRVGDAGFIIGILILWTYTGSLSFTTVDETVLDAKGQVVKDEHGDVEKRVTQLSFFDAIRAPGHDTHDEPIKVGGQIVRVNPTVSARGTRLLQVAEGGNQVVLWDQATSNS